MQGISNEQPLSSSAATELPLDVLEVIFRSLTPYDLAVCCRVNKQVHALAYEALYRDLRPNSRNVLRLCLKLCDEPDLARRVRSFVLRDNNVDMYLGSISEALLKLPRLCTLVLRIGPMSSWILPKGNCPFSLHSLDCEFYFDDTLLSFLQGQKELKHLSVSMSPSVRQPAVIGPRLFPELVSIVASMSVVEMITPGRPVSFVTAYHARHGDPPSISCLSKSSSNRGVRQLKVNYGYLLEMGCEQVAQAAPKLVHLTIDADNVKPDDYEACIMSSKINFSTNTSLLPQMLNDLTDWIEVYLSYAKDLSWLVVVFYPVLSVTPCQEIDFSEMVTRIFAASVKLTHVVILFHSLKARYICKQIPGQDWYIVNE